MKEKISISLDKEITKKVDSLIDNETISNRSQAIEFILRQHLKKGAPLKAVLLAGKTKNQALILKNLPRLLAKLRETNVRELIVAGSKYTPKIFEVINRDPYFSRNSIFLKEDKLVGTAGILKLAENYLDSTFIVLYSDIYFNFDLNVMLEFHRKNHSQATMAITLVEKRNANDLVKVEGNYVVEYRYGKKPFTQLTNAAIYIFEPEILRFTPSKGSLEKEVLPELAKNRKLFAFNFSAKWEHLE